MKFKSKLIVKIAQRMTNPANTIKAPIGSRSDVTSVSPREKRTGTKTISAGTKTISASSLEGLKKLGAAKNVLESRSLSKKDISSKKGGITRGDLKDPSKMQSALEAAVYRKSESLHAENKDNFARTLSGLKRPGYGDELKHTSPK